MHYSSMKKIYLIFITLVLITIGITIFAFSILSSKQVAIFRDLIQNQENKSVKLLENTSINLESNITTLLKADSVSQIFAPPIKNVDPLKPFELFYSKYQKLISGISIIDNNKHVFNLLYKEKTDRYITDLFTAHFQKNLVKAETLEIENEQYQLSFPVINNGEIIYNVILVINFSGFLDLTFQNYKIEGFSWQWALTDSGKIIYSNYNSKVLNYGDLNTKNVSKNEIKFIKHKFVTENGQKIALTGISQITLAKKNLFLAFSVDSRQILKPTRIYFYIFLILIIISTLIVFYFLHVVIAEEIKNSAKSTEAEINLLKIFDSIPIGVMILTHENTISYINRFASELLFGKDETNVVGRNITDMIIPQHFKDKGKPESAYDTTHFYVFEKDGIEITVYKKGIPFRLNNQDLLIEAFIDVSPIEKARKLEAAANLAKSDFLAKMSHEIRTPMNGIVGMADALIQQNLTIEQKEMAEIIKKSSDLLLTIINDVLDFSKVEAGKMMLEEIPFKISDEINLVRELFKPLAEHKKIKIITNISPNVPDHIIGDPFRLRQVTTNLMSNATKFTTKGEVLINVELLESYSGHLTLQFSVEDTGIGIPSDKLDTIFSSYTQAEGSITRKYGGTGLGTTISKQLVELMGGEITVESPSSISTSPEAPGSKFSFTIEAYSNEKIDKNIDFSGITEYTDINALIVSTSDNESESVFSYFENFGITYEKYEYDALSSELFINKLLIEKDKFQIVIITDSLNFDGFRIAKQLYDKKILNDHLCILISSNDITGNYIRSRRLDIDCYLIKPYESSEVFDLVQNNFTSIKADAKLPAKLSQIRKNISILVAEDNLINQKVAKTIFKNIGYEIEIASNGVEAVDFTLASPYDIIFMDMMMPEKDGVQATKELRLRGYKGPIIAMTANASKEGKNKAISFGMDGYITKPTKMESIKKVLIKYFSEPV